MRNAIFSKRSLPEQHHGSVYEMMEFNSTRVVSVNKIYRTNNQLKAISGAAAHGDHFYVSSLADNAVLVCKRDNFWLKWGLIM